MTIIIERWYGHRLSLEEIKPDSNYSAIIPMGDEEIKVTIKGSELSKFTKVYFN